jgi:hypothetical protein
VLNVVELDLSRVVDGKRSKITVASFVKAGDIAAHARRGETTGSEIRVAGDASLHGYSRQIMISPLMILMTGGAVLVDLLPIGSHHIAKMIPHRMTLLTSGLDMSGGLGGIQANRRQFKVRRATVHRRQRPMALLAVVFERCVRGGQGACAQVRSASKRCVDGISTGTQQSQDDTESAKTIQPCRSTKVIDLDAL